MRFNIMLAVMSAAVVFFINGCAVKNNHKAPKDMAQHFIDCGIAVDKVEPLSTAPLRANEAAAIKIGGNEIGVYKYNIDTAVQADRLEKLKKAGRVYVIGIPFPIVTQGSFVILGLEKHPRKKELLEAIKTFK